MFLTGLSSIFYHMFDLQILLLLEFMIMFATISSLIALQLVCLEVIKKESFLFLQLQDSFYSH